VLLATVAAVRRDSPTHANLQLVCGGTRLVARITRASADRLQLAPGKPVFAIIKSVTVDTQMAAHGD
jgi:molybdate transport system ATP-binding protein